MSFAEFAHSMVSYSYDGTLVLSAHSINTDKTESPRDFGEYDIFFIIVQLHYNGLNVPVTVNLTGIRFDC